MSAVPHRKQLIARLREYPWEHAHFLEWTRQRYYASMLIVSHNRVKPPAERDTPHGAEFSNSVSRMVCSRDTIVERITAQAGILNADLIKATDRLIQFWDWWKTLTDVAQAFVSWRYWHKSTHQQVAQYFQAHGGRFSERVPDSEKKVRRFEDNLLNDLENLWYYHKAEPAQMMTDSTVRQANEKRLKALQLKLDGISIHAISRELNVSRQRVYQYLSGG